MARLFFALQPTASQRAAMHAAAAAQLVHAGARSVPADDLHLTLCFLGEVEPPTVEALSRAVPRLDSPASGLWLDHIDWWRTSGVLCLLPRENAALAQVAELAGALRDVARRVGIAVDTREFRAHVTVGRKVNAAAATAGMWPQALARPLPLTAGAVALMRSTGHGEGPRYTVVHRWPCPVHGEWPP